jgi:hypothetical protein
MSSIAAKRGTWQARSARRGNPRCLPQVGYIAGMPCAGTDTASARWLSEGFAERHAPVVADDEVGSRTWSAAGRR